MRKRGCDHYTCDKQTLRRCKLWLLLIILELLSAISAFGQYRFDSWTTDNGLPQNSIYAIQPTRDGYLWLTTLNGLARFDGVRFVVFDRGNAAGMVSNRCTALFEDADGTLWVGTEDGGVMNYRAGAFSGVLNTSNGLPHNRVIGFQADGEGGLLITTLSGQITWRNGQLHSRISADVRRFTGSSGVNWLLGSVEVSRTAPGQPPRTIRLPYPQPLSQAQRMSLKLFEDRRGNLWIGAPDQGLARISGDGQSFLYSEKDGIPKAELMEAIYEDREGTIWLGTRGPGALSFRQGRATVFGPAQGLPSNMITCITEDREGTLWMGSINHGLIRVSRRFINSYSSENGLVNNNVHPIYQDRTGRLWIGTAGGLSLLENGRQVNYTKQNGLSRDRVQALCEDREGNMWIGMMGGLMRFSAGRFVDETALVGDVTVLAICQDRGGAMWFGTQSGLFKWDGSAFAEHFTTEHGLPSNDIKAIYEDRRGRLWVGTYGGLAQFNDGQLKVYTTSDGLTGNRVRAIYEDDQGIIWIGTYDDGLSRFKDERFVNFKVENGLYNNGVFQILEDGHGYFWMSSNKGIHRVSKQQLNDFAAGRIAKLDSFGYGKQDGMLTIECNGGRQPGGFKTRDGKLWFPTQEGAIAIDPDGLTFNPLPPPVLIEKVMLEHRQVDFGQALTINDGQRYLEIEYTALSFIKADQVKFKYKLEGQDNNWVDVGTRRTAYFSQLPPGQYTFTVIAANSDGVWNEQGQSLKITVLPPFYRTWWFTLLTALALGGLAAALYHRRIAQLKREQARQTAFSRQLIESQEVERKRIAAELHDSLGQSLLIIKNRAYLGTLQPDDTHGAQEQLHEISEATADAIHQVREIAYYLRPSQLDRLGLTTSIEEMLDHVSGSSSILFEVNLAPLDGVFSSEEEINFYRIVQECLNNIVKHSRATSGEVIVRRNEHLIELIVRDNGQGFVVGSPSNPQSALRNPRSGGFGLTGIAERVRMLGGEHSIHSAPGQSTTIHIQIPVKGTPHVQD